jgi:hypothetical protein
LGKKKVIRELPTDDDDKARFQLTGEVLVGDGNNSLFDYDREAIFTLDLTTGDITSDTPNQPLTEIASWYGDALVERSRADIKRVIQGLMKEKSGLFCFNEEVGGHYFVPGEHIEFAARIDRVLRALGGKLSRVTVIMDTDEGKEAIAEAMEHTFEEMIKDMDEVVEKWDDTTRSGSFTTQAKRYQEARFKLECVEAYLGDRMQHIQAKIAASNQAMKQKILKMGEEEGDKGKAARTYTEKLKKAETSNEAAGEAEQQAETAEVV